MASGVSLRVPEMTISIVAEVNLGTTGREAPPVVAARGSFPRHGHGWFHHPGGEDRFRRHHDGSGVDSSTVGVG
jgi:hypothetical protein